MDVKFEIIGKEEYKDYKTYNNVLLVKCKIVDFEINENAFQTIGGRYEKIVYKFDDVEFVLAPKVTSEVQRLK